MNIGLFSAMALVLALPTGAGGGFVLLVCSIFYLAVHRRRAGPRPAGRYEWLFLAPASAMSDNVATSASHACASRS